MFNVIPKGLNYNMKTDKFYPDCVTGMIKTSLYLYYKFTIPKFLLCLLYRKKPLENTKEPIKNGQFKETGNIGHIMRRKTQHNMRQIPRHASKHK